MSALEDETWQWDDDEVDSDLTGIEAQRASDRDMMAVTGADSPAEAYALLRGKGRPRLSEGRGEKSVSLNFRVPESVARAIEEERKSEGLRYNAEYIRRAIVRDLEGRGRILQTA